MLGVGLLDRFAVQRCYSSSKPAARIDGVIAPSPLGAGCRGLPPRSNTLTATRAPKTPLAPTRPFWLAA